MSVENVWALQGLPSVLPYSFIYQTDKAVYALRQFMSSCLYDRISTRPFLSHVEKKWIAYQLLRAVSSAHEREVCHGDIKTENVMITSWNWVYLTDFASFKPTYLPENDPADFSYFFDSSGRRSCYLAPERFVSSEIYGKNSALMNEGLTTEMDTFSLGCVFAELFLDGNALFDLSQLLSYKRGNYSTESILSKVNDLYVAKLITEMINIDPLKRTLISDYLARDNPTFPKFFLHFYEFMQSIVHCRDFLDGQRGSVGSLCDYRIKMVYDSFEFLLTNIITLNSHMEANYLDEEEFKELMETVNISGVSNLKYSREFNKGESTSLLLSLLTSSIREAVLPSSRLMVVDMLVMLGLFSTDAIRLDLITPYLLLLCSDEDARVRCQSVKSLSLMLFHVKQIFPLDADMFSEYLFPELLPLKSDSCEFVRVAFASCFGALAETSIKFVELSQRNQDTESTGVSSKENRVTFETKMSDLHNLLLEIVTEFLLDKSNRVKRALLEGMTSLCLFLGKQKVNDVLLSHTITYLNSEDWSLRRSVIASLVEVGTFLGTKSLEQYILPVLMQSLTDQEELVVERVLLTLFSLADLKFIREERLRNVLVQTLPLLNHPGLRVRKGMYKHPAF
jgi:phosphoinositide-3-kinase regulatory subunit 4